MHWIGEEQNYQGSRSELVSGPCDDVYSRLTSHAYDCRRVTDQYSGWPHEIDKILNTPAQNLVALNALEVVPQLGAINVRSLI